MASSLALSSALSSAVLSLPLAAAAAAARAEDYPTAGDNPLSAGGGGSCSYLYEEHDGMPVVTSATCTISASDLDMGCGTDQATRDCAPATPQTAGLLPL